VDLCATKGSTKIAGNKAPSYEALLAPDRPNVTKLQFDVHLQHVPRQAEVPLGNLAASQLPGAICAGRWPLLETLNLLFHQHDLSMPPHPGPERISLVVIDVGPLATAQWRHLRSLFIFRDNYCEMAGDMFSFHYYFGLQNFRSLVEGPFWQGLEQLTLHHTELSGADITLLAATPMPQLQCFALIRTVAEFMRAIMTNDDREILEVEMSVNEALASGAHWPKLSTIFLDGMLTVGVVAAFARNRNW
jgi:hypothetical protein